MIKTTATEYLIIDTTDGAGLVDVHDLMDAWFDDDPAHEILSIHLVRPDGRVQPAEIVEHDDTDEYEITADGEVVEYLRYDEYGRVEAHEVDGVSGV